MNILDWIINVPTRRAFSDNFVNSNLANWISVIGSILSLIGVGIAIYQIYKTRCAAEAAKTASLQTQKDISRNLLLSDISICVKYIEEIRLYLRHKEYVSAQVRVNDLISQLNQTQEVLKSSNQVHQIEFEKILLQLSIIRENFEKKLAKSSAKIDGVLINNKLSTISDDSNKLIGETKIAIKKGEQNG